MKYIRLWLFGLYITGFVSKPLVCMENTIPPANDTVTNTDILNLESLGQSLMYQIFEHLKPVNIMRLARIFHASVVRGIR